ncbi:peptidoglycan-binding domain-containing protein [Allocoleopsis franciscana]|uniref:Putative peptidoglycan-binding domain-containing protein n=1 Tax=Allocoleopsis franciscana PCC 7113 TaxID=1173027 RepID=K9W7Y8_9CYAN|nr:peptidoglycan-binding protein [Allocoleopsis franciscana]AFZ16343.1 putative peptidoglycan-binding domain-containing protein [Allocoleopsis franciscana PCC 7113]
METLAYLHVAAANEESTDTHYALAAIWKNPKLLTCLNSPQFSTRAAVPLLSLTVVLGILGLAKQAFALVKPGDRNSEVMALQQRLQRLGYFNGPTTGYYGPLTKQAVLRYQRAKGLAADGVVGTSTKSALQGQRKQAVEEPSHPIWKIGDRDSKVGEIQKILADSGYPSSTNGVFDQETQEAVRLFQQAKGLKVDGIVGKETLTALSDKSESRTLANESNPDELKLNQPKPDEFKLNQPTPDEVTLNQPKPDELTLNQPKPDGKKSIRWESIEEPETQAVDESTKSFWQIGDRGSKVSEIQKQLATAGFQNDANGVFDIKTQEAVRLFQRSKGLKVDGIVGEQTLTALSDKDKPKTQLQPEPEQTTPWYEDNSAPLNPFTR